MKRILLIITTFILICAIFSGCNNSSNQSNSANNIVSSDIVSSDLSINILRDLSVSLENECKAPTDANKVINDNSAPDSIYSSNLTQIISASKDVIRGLVQKVSYAPIGGNAWTKMDVLVTESYKGDLRIGDLISVFRLGGYITLQDHINFNNDAFRFKDLTSDTINKTVIKQTVEGEAFPSIGDDFVYCITPTRDNWPLPKGSYARLTAYGQLSIDQNGKFVQKDFNGDKLNEFSLDEIKAMIK